MRAEISSSLILVLSVALAGGCSGPTTLHAQMDHAETQGREAEARLDEAEKALDVLDADRAEKLIDDARDYLRDPSITKYPEHSMLKERVHKDENRLLEARKEIAKRELERRVLERRQKIEVASNGFESVIAAALRPDVTAVSIEAAREKGEDVDEVLKDNTELDAKDKALADYVEGVRKTFDKAMADVRRSERGLSFREGPGKVHAEGVGILEQAALEKELEKLLALHKDARSRFDTCASKGKELIGSSPELAKMKIELDGKTTTPETVSADCSKQSGALAKKITQEEKKVKAAQVALAKKIAAENKKNAAKPKAKATTAKKKR